MAPRKRGRQDIEVVEEDLEEEEPSSSEEEEDEELEAEDEHDDAVEEPDEQEEAPKPSKAKKITLSLSSDRCKVCGQRGHKAGFVGSVYIDCINKPCYLCKQPGHTTATCPFRLQPGLGTRPANRHTTADTLLQGLHQRELHGRHATQHGLHKTLRPPQYQVKSAILKLHSRRVTCLEFFPEQHAPSRDHLVMSGDKKGLIAMWDMDKVRERTLFRDVHRYLVSAVKCVPWVDDASVVTTSCDGTARVLDVETGLSRELVDLNPGGYTTDKAWRMLYAADTSPALKTVVVGDSDGRVHLLDPRMRGPANSLQLHKKANKVVSVSVNPVDSRLILTAGNDHTARLFDVRALTSSSHPGAGTAGGGGAGPSSPQPLPSAAAPAGPSTPTEPSPPASGKKGGGRGSRTSGSGAAAATAHPAELLVLKHPRVVNAAYFSPLTGRKVMSTAQDNRVRVWDNLLTAACAEDAAPDREIVHSHDFNRYLTPFKAEWDPKDANENRFVIGRYISEDFGGVALHPVDVLDAATGELLRECVDHNLTTICPVNKPHPRRNVIVSGSSRSLYLWGPTHEEEEEEQEAQAAANEVAGDSDAAAAARRTYLHYTFFDSDPGGSAAKKGKKGKGKGKGGAPFDDDDDDD